MPTRPGSHDPLGVAAQLVALAADDGIDEDEALAALGFFERLPERRLAGRLAAAGRRARELEVLQEGDVVVLPAGRARRHLEMRMGRILARPDLVVCSPYRRAADTARAALAELDVELLMDERLRERDLGLLDGLTGKGIRARYPEEAERRSGAAG